MKFHLACFAPLGAVVAAACSLVACGGDVSAGASVQDPDAGQSAGDAPAEGALWDVGAADEPAVTVYEPSEPCGAEPFPGCANPPLWPVVLSASDVGEGVEFVTAHLRYSSVAVAAISAGVPVPTGPFLLLAQAESDTPWSWHKLVPVPAPGAQTVPVGVAITFEASGTRLYTMLCDQASCQLYSGTHDFYADAATEGELTPVPGGELAGTPSIQGLALRGMDGNQVCAFGDGVYCFDGGGWETLVAPGVVQFEAADRNGGGILSLAGADGLVRTVSEDGSFDDVHAVGGPTLVSLGAISVDWAAGGQTGEVLSSRAIQGVHACKLRQEAIVGVRQGYANTVFISASGRVVVAGDSSGWCEGDAVPESPVVAVTADTCGIGENVLALTSDSLFGRVFCAVD